MLCGGVLLRLIDTAGIRATKDPVEQLGVERSRRAIASAELVIVLIDGTGDITAEDREILELARTAPHYIVADSKSDLLSPGEARVLSLPRGVRGPDAYLSVSSVAPSGLRLLEEAVAEIFPAGDPGEEGSLLTDRRQEDAARRALNAVRRALEALEAGMTPDAVLTDGEEALDALGELTGRTAKEEIVSRIFSRFCVGK